MNQCQQSHISYTFKNSFVHIIYNALPNSTSITEASCEPILSHFPEETITQILVLFPKIFYIITTY